MKKPIIGITSGFNNDGDTFLRRRYCLAVEEAGGVPLILPPLQDSEAAISVCNGLLISGGGDVLPEFYGQSVYDPKKLIDVSKERDIFELKLVRLAHARNLPILAICRGLQVLNVALDGTLLIDIPGHRQNLPRHEASHSVQVGISSKLYALTGKRKLNVNSFHHQAIGKTAEGLRVSAISSDKTIEAVEAKNKNFILGVQWHPEHMLNTDSELLFKSFILSSVTG